MKVGYHQIPTRGAGQVLDPKRHRVERRVGVVMVEGVDDDAVGLGDDPDAPTEVVGSAGIAAFALMTDPHLVARGEAHVVLGHR